MMIYIVEPDTQTRVITQTGEDVRQIRFTAEGTEDGDVVNVGQIPTTGKDIVGINDASVKLAVNSLMLDKTGKALYILNVNGWEKWTE